MINGTHTEELRHAIAARRENGRLFLLVATLAHDAKRDVDTFVDREWIEAAHDDVAVKPAVLDHCHVHIRGERFHGGPACEHAIVMYRHADKPDATPESIAAGMHAHFEARAKAVR